MHNKIAVVFDCAGTLLHMYRLAKEISTGNLLEGIESTMLVAERPERALVAIHTEPVKIEMTNPDTELKKFIAQNQLKIDIICSNGSIDMQEVIDIINKEDKILVGDILEVLYRIKQIYHQRHYLATGLIVDRESKLVPYVVTTAGELFPNTYKTIELLHQREIDVYIASGDTMHSLIQVANKLRIPLKNVFGVATSYDKANIVESLKKDYDRVLMVGDGINDILALKVADIAIVTVQQRSKRPQVLMKSADIIINNIIDVVDIVDSTVASLNRY
jgi:Cu+-exporting ATPase